MAKTKNPYLFFNDWKIEWPSNINKYCLVEWSAERLHKDNCFVDTIISVDFHSNPYIAYFDVCIIRGIKLYIHNQIAFKISNKRRNNFASLNWKDVW